jgi:hypothetical protein
LFIVRPRSAGPGCYSIATSAADEALRAARAMLESGTLELEIFGPDLTRYSLAELEQIVTGVPPVGRSTPPEAAAPRDQPGRKGLAR